MTLSLSPFSLMLAVDLLYIYFMFRYVMCILDLSKTFIMKQCLNLSKSFSAYNEIIMFLFFFHFVYMMVCNDRFLYVEPSLQIWDEAYLVLLDAFSDVFLDLFCNYF